MRYTPTLVTTAIMLGLTLWLVVGRFKARADSNWPLFYYLALVAYHQGFVGRLNPGVVYTAVVTALFLRFEFMGGWFNILLRFLELASLLYFCWRFWGFIVG